MMIGVPKETFTGENRVALVPASIPALIKAGLEVAVQAGAGTAAGFPDKEYQEKGASIVAGRVELFNGADIILQVRPPGANPTAGKADLEMLRTGQVLIGLHDPLGEPGAVKDLASRGVAAFALELMPRISRAQSMDALSSMATITGYKAVLLAADALPRMFPMLMTAAGTVTPARVFVIGAGVAGLQAIATAHRLGATVRAYDVRPAVKEQVESLGARFAELGLETNDAEDKGGYAKEMGEEFLARQRELLKKEVMQSDVVITTAVVPGKKAAVLITADMVEGMTPGSVIVDLAAEHGGNCELTEEGKTIVTSGVTLIGPVNLAASVPYHASQMYAKNISTFLLHLVKDGKLDPEAMKDDQIAADTMLTRGGEVVNQRIRTLLGLDKKNEQG
ncbi:MAG TPA: Re/Si-specific NAD(P)(+) transhydrogenase subunit alpha [bacterium]|nr:Re/Si-specific NAD(P)(+) transhydrogenase subunit alpha [bacterium]